MFLRGCGNISELKLAPNKGFKGLNKNYLFSEVRRKTQEFLSLNGGDVINLGVGDVAYPLPQVAVQAMSNAVLELGDNMRFRGYPPENGYDFLKNAIVNSYKRKGVFINEEEIFVGDGTKTDTACFSEIFAKTEVLIPDPVYPVYLDSAKLNHNKVRFLNGCKSNGFLPMPENLEKKPYLIWICSPNNPTGSVYSKAQLKIWVDFALQTGSLILFDSAYSAFVDDNGVKSIYQIEDANACAVEFCSLSKSAGFTNLRCSWVVVPKQITVGKSSVNALWKRRQSAYFNGVSYPTQRAGEAVLSELGEIECQQIIEIYKQNSCVLGGFLKSKGVWCAKEGQSPYVWFECPNGLSSWQFFDFLLKEARIVGTPGCGFGKNGEGFFRFSCFAKEQTVQEALQRLKAIGW